MLSDLETIQLGVGYRLRGQPLKSVPALIEDLEAVSVDYEFLPGWMTDISKVLLAPPVSAAWTLAGDQEQHLLGMAFTLCCILLHYRYGVVRTEILAANMAYLDDCQTKVPLCLLLVYQSACARFKGHLWPPPTSAHGYCIVRVKPATAMLLDIHSMVPAKFSAGSCMLAHESLQLHDRSGTDGVLLQCSLRCSAEITMHAGAPVGRLARECTALCAARAADHRRASTLDRRRPWPGCHCDPA